MAVEDNKNDEDVEASYEEDKNKEEGQDEIVGKAGAENELDEQDANGKNELDEEDDGSTGDTSPCAQRTCPRILPCAFPNLSWDCLGDVSSSFSFRASAVAFAGAPMLVFPSSEVHGWT